MSAEFYYIFLWLLRMSWLSGVSGTHRIIKKLTEGWLHSKKSKNNEWSGVEKQAHSMKDKDKGEYTDDIIHLLLSSLFSYHSALSGWQKVAAIPTLPLCYCSIILNVAWLLAHNEVITTLNPHTRRCFIWKIYQDFIAIVKWVSTIIKS